MHCCNTRFNSKLPQARSDAQPGDKRPNLVQQRRQSSQLSHSHCHRLSVLAGATESSQQTPASVLDLKAELQDAIRLEAYSRAAEIRDALKSLEASDPSLLQEQLEECVAQERYNVCLPQYKYSMAPVFRLMETLHVHNTQTGQLFRMQHNSETRSEMLYSRI